MSKDDITAILDNVVFEFVKYNDGDIIYQQNEECTNFTILIQGTLQAITEAPDKSYKLTEELNAPFAIEPYSLFGYNTRYSREYIAKGNCAILKINKKFLFSDFIKHNIFTINFLNLVTHKVQKQSDVIWKQMPGSISGRIVKFISLRCEQQQGRKILSIKMDRLASLLCETRLNISKSLNEMQKAGLLELHRKEIIIPSLKRLTDSITE
jgi:CRP-like cAMP-binding protein